MWPKRDPVANHASMTATREPISSADECRVTLPDRLGLPRGWSGTFVSDDPYERTSDWRKLPGQRWRDAVTVTVEWMRTLSPGVSMLFIDASDQANECRISISVGGIEENDYVVTDENVQQLVAKIAEGLGIEITLR